MIKAIVEKDYWLSSDGQRSYITVNKKYACPFCGNRYLDIKKHNIRRTIEGKREYILGYQIVCSCGIRTADYVGEQQAINAWMRRSDDGKTKFCKRRNP